ncbi:hypothetical protein EYZ11_013002 [Aspergillus tanneri]|uniref:Cytochrome P450 n=1 Tax=Aspergillus tanneri TaxID=1220188 RepID=A0A4S3J464_9EURO|nr:hypothetical protein EYZ11_013002 [Aspergillus tanneri]
MTCLVQMEPSIGHCVSLLVERFRELAKTGQTFDMRHWMQCYAFDVIGLITLDKRFGFLDAGQDQGGLLPAVDAYFMYATHVGVYHEMHPILIRLLSFLPTSGMIHLQNFAVEQVNHGKALLDAGYRMDDAFLVRLLRMHAQNPEKMSLNDVITYCGENVGAGSHTTSISIAAIMYHLLNAPIVYVTLREEIDLATSQGRISSSISYQEAQKLPYLQACTKEAIRVHPVTGLPMMRVVPKGGMTLCGRYFPKGVERWFDSDERVSLMERNLFSFGAGTRTCIGKNISLIEISKLVPELIRRFDFKLANPEIELKTVNRWFVQQKNVLCRVHLR